MTSSTKPTSVTQKAQPAFLPLVFLLLFGIGWVVGMLFSSLTPSGLVVYFAFLLALSLIMAIVDLYKSLPAQNIISVVGLAIFVSVLIEIVNAKTRLPLGQSDWLNMFGPPLFHLLRWPVPFIVITNLLNSRGVARLVMSSWRNRNNYGLLSFGLTALLMALSNLGIEQFETVNLWFALGIHTLIAAVMLVVVTPWLIVKKPAPIPAPSFYPFLVWFLFLGILFGHS